MRATELDALLAGEAGVVVGFEHNDGGRIDVYLSRHELASPIAWRAAMRRAFGHEGYEPPHYSQEDHDQIVRVLFRLVEAEGDR